jgi:vitamin B12 transporter
MYLGRSGVFTSSDFLNDSLAVLRRHHASYQADWRLANDARRGQHTLTLLGDWDGERATVTNRRASTQTIDSRDNFGASAQNQMLWRRFFLTLSGRIERNENFGTAAVPRAAAVYVLHERSANLGETHIKASAGTGIKEPTMLESFSESPFSRGNPDLKPERSRSAEVGIDQRLAGDRVKFEVTYFHNRFSDVIAVVTTNPATFAGQYTNIGETRARGLELNAEAAPVSSLRLRASYTRLDGKVIASASPNDPVFGLGHELLRRPRHSGAIGVGFRRERLTADLNDTFIGRFADSDFGLFSPSFSQSPGHSLWDARVTLMMTKQLTGMLMVDNLTNQDYSEPLGYQPLLRAVRVGLRVGF